MKSMPQHGGSFGVQPRFLHGSICYLWKKAAVPMATVQLLLEEFKIISQEKPVSVEVGDKTFELSVRRPIDPDRLKRNRLLRNAAEFIKKEGKNVPKEDFGVCYLAGAVKAKKLVCWCVSIWN